MDNIDDAYILGVGSPQAKSYPDASAGIFFNLQPVGCTATILYQMYIERGIDVPAH